MNWATESMRWLFGILPPVLLGIVTSGCSLTKYEHRECSSNAECRSAFGLKSVCGSSGMCEELKVPPRCTATYPEDLFQRPEKYQDIILFGSLMDRSVPKKVARERAIRLAAFQANGVKGAEGLEGRLFGLVQCTIEKNNRYDDLSIEDAAVQSAKFLVNTLNVPAIIGPSGSSTTTAVFEALQGTQTLVISPSATSPALTDLDQANVSDEHPGLLWRTAPPDSFQGKAIAADMLERGVKKVAVLHQTDAYGQGLANVFNDDFTKGGGKVNLVPWSDANERTEAITKVSSMDFDEVLFIASNSSDVVAFLTAAAADPGYGQKNIFLPDSAASDDVFRAASSARNIFSRIRGSRVKPLGEEFAYKAFVTAYHGEYNDDVTKYSFTAQSFDATWLVIYGSAWSWFRHHDIFGVGIAQGLRKISCTANGAKPCNARAFEIVPSSWPGVISQFRNGTAVELNGASGKLDYDLKTEETSADIQIWVLDASGHVIPADGASSGGVPD